MANIMDSVDIYQELLEELFCQYTKSCILDESIITILNNLRYELKKYPFAYSPVHVSPVEVEVVVSDDSDNATGQTGVSSEIANPSP